MRGVIITFSVIIFATTAFWLIRGSTFFANASYVGTYVASTETPTGDILRVLVIREDGSAKLTSDMGSRGTVIDSGSWQASGSLLAVNVKYSNIGSRPLPTTIEMAKSRNGLNAISYDENIYGRFGLSFYKIWPEDPTKTSNRLGEAKKENLNNDSVYASLVKGSWGLVSETSGDVVLRPSIPAQITFGGIGLTGEICNSFSGAYTIKNLSIEAPVISATKKACAGPEMTIENDLFSSLKDGVDILFNKDGRLYLFNNGKRFELIKK